jgi:hypothetical protein
MTNQRFQKMILTLLVMTGAVLMIATAAAAELRTRIVVLPFYVEKGHDADTGSSDIGLHFRRMSGFIENHLVRHNFEVIDPFARDASEAELNAVMEKAKQDSLMVARNMCQRYAVDAAYIVWLTVKTQKTADGYYQASAILDGKGYDSGGRSLGANVLKTFKVTRRDFDEAVAVVEKEVGDVVGRTLTNWSDNRPVHNVVGSSGQTNAIRTSKGSNGKGVLQQNIEKQAQYVNLRLDQANEYELVEAFGKVVNTVRGVTAAKRYNQRIVPDNPQACVTEWEVAIDTNQTDPFRLQANIMKMVNDILDAGGTIRINGVPYRYTPSEMKLMMGLRPGEATSRSIQFVVDRERARDREFSGRHDPENAAGSGKKAAFE